MSLKTPLDHIDPLGAIEFEKQEYLMCCGTTCNRDVARLELQIGAFRESLDYITDADSIAMIEMLIERKKRVIRELQK